MYKVYHDAERKSVMATQQKMTNDFKYQCSEERYKELIEKLEKENTYLKNKVSIYLACYTVNIYDSYNLGKFQDPILSWVF